MENRVIWLRMSYWVGALVDAKAAVLLLFPGLIPGLTKSIYGGITGETMPDILSLRWLSAILILSWTFLLFWADRKPVERQGVLLIGVFPVCSGILALRLRTLFAGGVASVEYLLFTLFMAALTLYFLTSYILGGRETAHNDPPI